MQCSEQGRDDSRMPSAEGVSDDVREAPREAGDLTLRVNGRQHTIRVEPRRVLSDVLRLDLGLYGTKQACGMGDCGACTVLLDGRAVYSCLVLGVECRGSSVVTIEGLGDAEQLDPIQRAFIEADAYQCGYCTAGQIMSLRALFDRVAVPDEAQIRTAVSGNLCRCGAYRNILEAARRVAEAAGRKAHVD